MRVCREGIGGRERQINVAVLVSVEKERDQRVEIKVKNAVFQKPSYGVEGLGH